MSVSKITRLFEQFLENGCERGDSARLAMTLAQKIHEEVVMVAVKQEREECAQTCEAQKNYKGGVLPGANQAAKAIRSRGA